jgi:simple sugar transport system ATP-binding protein
MIGKKVKKITKISKNRFLNSPIAISINNLNRKKLSQFGTELKKISFNVKYGEILGIAGVAGNGQVELMNALSGETLGDPDEIIFEDKKIGNTNIKFRRSLGLEFVPEERNGHATVPDITLTENTFLTFYNAYSKNNNFLDNILLSSNMSSNDSISIINDNDVRCPYSNPLADQLSGGNLQKFIVGRSLKANPKVLIISQPTWGVDIGAASEIRSKLLLLAKAGKAIILISQDLDEIYEISNKICVINNGSLSTPKITSKISATDIGILMGIN